MGAHLVKKGEKMTPLLREVEIELNPDRVKRAYQWRMEQWEHNARTCKINFLKDDEFFEIPDDYIPVLHWLKSDRKEVVKYLVKEDNAVILKIDEQMAAASGTAAAQIIFVTCENDIKLKTPLLYFEVSRGLGQSRIRSVSEYSILNDTLDKITALFRAIPDVKDLIDKTEEATTGADRAATKAERSARRADAATKESLKATCESKKATKETKEAAADAIEATRETKKATRKAECAAVYATKTSKEMKKWMLKAEDTYISARKITI